MRKRGYILLFLLASGFGLFAQSNYFEYLSTKDGLSDYSVNSLYEDEYARMWIGTRNGLNCYDGHYFRIWNAANGLQDSYIRRVVGDHNRHILIQTRAQAYLMDLTTDSITPLPFRSVSTIAGCNAGLWVVSSDTIFRVSANQDIVLQPILTIPGITAISPIDSLSIWVASNNGVQLFLNGYATGHLYADIHHVVQFMMDSRRNIWICTRGEGLYMISSQLSLSHYTTEAQNPHSLTDNDVRCITEDFFGNYWIGLYGGLCHLDTQTGHIKRYEYDPRAEHALSTFSVWALTTDKQGTIWIGTFFGGIDLFNPEYSVISYYGVYGKEGHHLSNPIVSCTFMDKQNNLWIGSNGGGINYLNHATNTIDFFRIDNETPQPAVKSLWMDSQRHRLWIGTHRGGLKWMDTQTHRVHTFTLPEQNIRKLIERNDTLWILTQHDIYTIYLPTEEYQRQIPSRLMPAISGEFCDLELIEDQIWFAHTHHLYCYSTLSKQFVCYPFETNITVLCSDMNHQLLIGTDTRGIWQMSDSGFVEMTAINKNLSSSYIMSIAAGEKNYMIASNKEISIFNEAWECYSSYTTDKELPLDALIEHSGVIYGNKVAIGGVNGLVMLPVNTPRLKREPTAIQLSHILIDDEGPNLNTSLPLVKEIHLEPSNHTISLQVTTSGFITRRNSKLRYRLKNYDHDWNITSNNAFISYTNLPHGKYLLEIECLGTSLRREILIHVQPHWYNSWWGWILYFILGATGLCIALFYFGQYVEKKTRKQMKSSYQQDLQRATAIVMNHLADDTFNVQQFAKEMFVSRTGLYTKIQEITGQTPNDFILSLRMREAATLLRTEHTMSIVDISVRVGFNSSSYFIKCFHKFYGKSPTSWRKDTKNASTTGDGRRGK